MNINMMLMLLGIKLMKYNFFLGGTCGDSTWRQSVIPILDELYYSWFNPQLGVGEWTPEHQAIEAKAKENSDSFIFFISPETRGIASMIEAAYLMGTPKRVLLVLPEGENTFSESENRDILRGKSYLREVAKITGNKVFKSLAELNSFMLEIDTFS